MADLGEEAFSSQMKVVATFLRLLEELMRNKQQDLRYGTKTQRRGILGRMKDFVGGIFKKVYDGTFGRLSRNGKDYGQLDLNDPAVAKLFADTMKQMGMDAMHEDNNLLFSTSDVAKILAFSKMVEQELGKKIEHENDTPEKEQSQVHGQDQERQADARGWSDYPATPEQIDLTATVLAADEGVSIDEIKKDFSENPSIGELQIALEAKGHDTMAIQPDLKNYATPEQRAQLDMLKDKGIIGENELMQLGKYPSQDKASEVLENHADAVKMLDSDEISNRAEAIRSHDGMDPDSHTKQVESWKEDLSAKVGNAFEASRDANGQPNLNNFALQCNLRGIAVQFANDGELLFTDGGVVDFASDPGGWITDRFAEGAEFFFNDGLQNIKTTSTKSILGKSFNNLLGKKTGTFYSTVSFVNKSVVMPTAASILSLVMLIQLIKISQRIDGTATLPAIKDIVFLIIYATIFIWLLKNSLKICAGAYDLFNEMIGKINQSTVDELKTVTIADSCKESFGAVIGIWVQSMIFDLITIIIKGSVYKISKGEPTWTIIRKSRSMIRTSVCRISMISTR